MGKICGACDLLLCHWSTSIEIRDDSHTSYLSTCEVLSHRLISKGGSHEFLIVHLRLIRCSKFEDLIRTALQSSAGQLFHELAVHYSAFDHFC